MLHLLVYLLISSTGLLLATASLYALLVTTQFSDQVRVKDTSQLINGISSVLNLVLLKYFNGTTISTSFSKSLPSNFPVIRAL